MVALVGCQNTVREIPTVAPGPSLAVQPTGVPSPSVAAVLVLPPTSAPSPTRPAPSTVPAVAPPSPSPLAAPSPAVAAPAPPTAPSGPTTGWTKLPLTGVGANVMDLATSGGSQEPTWAATPNGLFAFREGWTQVRPGSFTEVAIDPRGGTRILASERPVCARGDSKPAVISEDGGVSWKDAGQGVWDFVYPADGSVVALGCASVQRLNPITRKLEPLAGSAVPNYTPRALDLAPDGSLWVVLLSEGGTARLRRTDAAGTGWSEVALPAGTSGVLDIVVDRRPGNGTVYLAAQEGLVRLWQGGRTWTLSRVVPEPQRASATTKTSLVRLAQAANGFLIGATDTAVLRSRDDGSSWAVMGDLGGAQVSSILPLGPQLFAATSGGAYSAPLR